MIRIAVKSFLFSLIASLIFGGSCFAQDTLRTYYDEDSLHVKEILTKRNGKAEGVVRLFDPTGKLILIGTLTNDHRDGLFYALDPESGETRAIIQLEDT